MIKDFVLQHKKEKEGLISKRYILREKLPFALPFLDKDLIKVITGPRRAGKSVFCFLLLKDKDFAYINFDDENLLKVNNYDEILQAIFEVYPESKFILFDEIQNLQNWEVFVNKLQRRGYNLILTGSNAKLLSKELATALTGRHVSVEVFPFSFREFLEDKNFKIDDKEYIGLPESKGKILGYLDAYLKNGGFPEVVVKGLEPREYLQTLFDAILFKDIVKRYKIRFSQKIYDLALYLISNFCCEFSFTRLRNNLGFRSTVTLQNYLKYLEESYLFFSLNRFSFKMKEQIKAPKKIYLIDNGFVLAKSFQFLENNGKLMENLVFVEILRKGYKLNESVFYYKTRNDREIDFILKDGTKIKRLIQVCWETDNIEVRKREMHSLVEASRELNCDDLVILSWDREGEEEFKGIKVKIVPLWKWLINAPAEI